MKRHAHSAVLIAFLFTVGCARAPLPIPEHSATTPVPRSEQEWWMNRHAGMNERAAQGEIDLVFIGDSITQGWEGNGKSVWAKYYAPRNTLNLGISGDRTQHVLWRLDNGNLDGIDPKAAVIMIGTNNHKDNTAEEIADGIESIVRSLREARPKMRILLLAVFPRGEHPNEYRSKLDWTNLSISALGDGKRVFYLDIGHEFMNNDMSISEEIMPDFLHLTERGYEIWAEAIEESIADLLGE